MSIAKRVFINFSWLALSEVSSRILIFMGTAYLARVLGKDGFGLYSLSLAVGVYAWSFTDLGVAGYGTREIARNREHASELCTVLNSLRFFLALGLFTISCCVLYTIDLPLDKKLVLLAGFFYAVAMSISSDWVFRGLEEMKYITYGRIVSSLLFLTGIFLFVNDYSDTVLASYAYSVSFFAGSAVLLLILRRTLNIPFSLNVYLVKWKLHVRETLYFAINGIFNNVAIFIPVFFMGFWSTNEELGIFSAPHRLIIMLTNMSGLILMALYPTLSNLHAIDIQKFRETHMAFQKIVIGFTMPVCVISIIFGKEIIVLLFGAPYESSAAFFDILIVVTFLTVIRRTLGTALITSGFYRYNMYATGIGTLVIVIMSIVLIPLYNGYGAAWSLLGGEVITLLFMDAMFKKKVYRPDYFKMFFVKVLFAGGVMSLIVVNLPFSMILSAFIGTLVYGGLSLAIGVVSIGSVQQMCKKFIKL